MLARGEGEFWQGPVINALLIALALVWLTSDDSNAVDRLAVLGWIALIGGLVLLVLAWRARGQQLA